MSRESSSHDAILIINQKKREVAIFLIMTLLVLIILIAFPVRMMMVSISEVNNEIEGKRKIKTRLDEKIRDFTALNTQYEEIRNDLEDLPLIFPNRGDYSLFVANIDEICKTNYFRLESVNVDSARNTVRDEINPFKEFHFWTTNISVAGRRSDLVHLLEAFENMPMYPTVQVVGYKNELEDDGFLKFSISLRMYGVKDAYLYLDI